MADEDVFEQARAAGLTIATGVSRLGDTFIRAAHQRAEADVRDKQLQLEDARHRYEAQAQVADDLYRRAVDPEWMRAVDQTEALGVWEAAQLWADLDQERFRTAADQVTVAYQEAYGVEPSTAGVRAVRDVRMYGNAVDDDQVQDSTPRPAALNTAGWPIEAVHARTLSGHLNARVPSRSQTASEARAPGPAARARAVKPAHVRAEESGRS